jgi:hypothetical protein
LELLLTCLRHVAPTVRSSGFLQGTIAGLPRCRKRLLCLRAGVLVLQATKVNGDFQLVLFTRQAKALHLEAHVNVGKLCPEVA